MRIIHIWTQQSAALQFLDGVSRTCHSNVGRNRKLKFSCERKVAVILLFGGEAWTSKRHSHPQSSIHAVWEMLIMHTASVLGVRRISIISLRPRSAVKKVAANP